MSRTGAPLAAPSELTEIFRSLARQRRSGTLKVSDGAGRALYIYFRDGEIQLLRSRRARTPIGRALIKRRKLTESDLERALKLHQQTGQRLGQCCVRLGLCDEDAVREALVFQAIEEVSDVFTWPQPKNEFHRGQPPLDIFDFQDLDARLGLQAEALVREARRRAAEIAELRAQLPSFADIYAPSPEALYAMRSPPEGSPDEELLRFLDGVRDVDEVLEAVRLSELEALRTLIRLVRQGEVMALSPSQLVQVAAECERQGRPQKAHRLYLRAEAAGLVQLDLPNRIAKLADRLGRREEAVARYLEFADRCRAEELPEAAVAAYRKALELDPGSVQAMEEIVSALVELGQSSQAVAMLKQVAQHCDPRQDRDKVTRCWQEVLRLMPEDIDAHKALGQLYADQGDAVQAILLFNELAAIHISQGELELAISVLRRVLELDDGCVEAHLELATQLARVGRTREAVVEYERLAESLSRQTGLRHSLNWQFLIDTYEKIVALDPGHVRARQWLAQAYQEKAESDKAVGNYAALCDALRREPGEQPALAEALYDFVALQPDDFLAREELGRVLVALGRKDEAVTVLAEARDRALRAQKLDAARRAADQAVALAPFDLGARREQARIAWLEKEEERAFASYDGLARLAELGGAFGEACEAARKALELRNDPDLRELLARSLELGGNTEEAAKEYVESGRLEAYRENFGRARAAAERAVELDPDLRAAQDLLYMLENRRTASASGAVSGRWTEKVAQKPSITGGNPEVSIIERPQRAYGSISGAASRLKQLKGGASGAVPAAGAPARGAGGSGPAGGRGGASGGGAGGDGAPAMPESIADGAREYQAATGGGRALSAAAKLKALKGGGGAAASAPAGDGAAAPSIADALARLAARLGGGDGASAGAERGVGDRLAPEDADDLAAPPAARAAAAATAAPEEPSAPAAPPPIADGAREYQAASGGGRALSAAAKLKALKGGGAPAAPSTADALAALAARLGGGPAPAPAGGGPATSDSGRLGGLGGAAGGEALPVSPPRAPTFTESGRLAAPAGTAPAPIADGAREYQAAAGGGKALSAAAKLKALKGGAPAAPSPADALAALAARLGGGGGEAGDESGRLPAPAAAGAGASAGAGAGAPSPGGVAPIADGARDYLATSGGGKALSAAAKLKALKQGGGGGGAAASAEPPAASALAVAAEAAPLAAAGPPAQPIADGAREYQPTGGGAKAASAAARLKALRSGG